MKVRIPVNHIQASNSLDPVFAYMLDVLWDQHVILSALISGSPNPAPHGTSGLWVVQHKEHSQGLANIPKFCISIHKNACLCQGDTEE